MSPTVEEKRKRMFFNGKTHPDCKYVDRATGTCEKRQDHDCGACRTCPRCGGTLQFDKRDEIIRWNRVKRYQVATCINCGAWIERDIHPMVIVDETDSSSAPAKCSVSGCRHRTWSELVVTIDGTDYPVCDRHMRTQERWQRSTDKTIAHLYVDDDQLLVHHKSSAKPRKKQC